jgi:tRNA threonylcarbamoyladenosine biosynthesis protein TsaB
MSKKSTPQLLAIDTSTQHFSVCYFDGNHYFEKNILGDAKSSSYIIDMIDNIAIDWGNLDGMLYTKGPGAFTGIRVGMGVVCGLSLTHNLPTLGFSTLQVLEYQAIQQFNSSHIVSSIDARMEEVYIRHNNQEYLARPEEVPQHFQKYIGVGTGFQTYGNFTRCKEYYGEFHPYAKSLIDLGLQHIEKLNFEHPQPLYLRNNIAKKSTKKI